MAPIVPTPPSLVSGFAYEYRCATFVGATAGGSGGNYTRISTVPASGSSSADDLTLFIAGTGIWLSQNGPAKESALGPVPTTPAAICGAQFPIGTPATQFIYQIASKAGGTALNSQDFSALIVFDAPSPADGGAINQCIFDIAGNIQIGIDKDQQVMINNVGLAGGGGIGAIWAHCGRNAWFVRSTGSSVEIDAVGWPNVSLGATAIGGSSDVLTVSSDASGSSGCPAHIRWLSFFNTASVSSGDAQQILSWAADTFRISANYNGTAVFLGDGGLAGRWGYGQETIPQIICNQYQFIRGVTFSNAKGTMKTVSLSQVLLATDATFLSLVEDLKLAVIWCGITDLNNDVTLVVYQTDMIVAINALQTAGYKIMVWTILPNAVPAATDPQLVTREILRQTYNAWIRTACGGLADYVYDIAAEYEPASGSAADIRAVFTGPDFAIPNIGGPTWNSGSIDGLYLGPAGNRKNAFLAAPAVGSFFGASRFESGDYY